MADDPDDVVGSAMRRALEQLESESEKIRRLLEPAEATRKLIEEQMRQAEIASGLDRLRFRTELPESLLLAPLRQLGVNVRLLEQGRRSRSAFMTCPWRATTSATFASKALGSRIALSGSASPTASSSTRCRLISSA